MIKCFCVWPIHSCCLIWGSVCVVDTMLFERKVGSDKNKHDVLLLCGTG